MRKFRVWFSFDKVYEADDEGDALMQADAEFNVMSNARSEELDTEDDHDS
jgi:hypothetical protein